MNTSLQWTLRAPYQPSTFVLALAGIVGFTRRIGRALKHRHEAAMLGGLDDRMLADIGLTRSDVRDAYAEPMWRDPTSILASRAHERRANRPHGQLGEVSQIVSPPLSPQTGFSAPRTDRPARYAV